MAGNITLALGSGLTVFHYFPSFEFMRLNLGKVRGPPQPPPHTLWRSAPNLPIFSP